ncbi:MAG: WYL domain-containing protein [Ottowia sp.]|nr:WYL domain-containing protein [Ottowia sp.]
MTSTKKHAVSPPPKRSRSADAAAKGEKLAQRICDIFGLLHQGACLDKHELAAQFGVGVRTIERDLCVRLANYVERTQDGKWQLADHASRFISARLLDDYADMAGVRQLFPDRTLPWRLKQLKTPAQKRGLQVQPVPEEDITPQHFDALQTAVQQHHICYFSYSGKAREVQPYRLIHQHGTWYLAAFEPSANLDHPKAFSLTRIKALRVDENATFQPELRHLDYLNRQSDIWLTQSTTRATLRVAAPAAHYFRQRDLLPQQTTQESSGGSLIVTTRINHPTQLLPVVRFWMPHVRIIEPREWEQTLIEELRQTLRAWGAAEPPEQPAKKPPPPKRAKGKK